MRVLLIVVQPTADGPGQYAERRLPGRPFFVAEKGMYVPIELNTIQSHLRLSSKGTLYYPHYPLKRAYYTATYSKGLSTRQLSTNSLSAPLTVCNLFLPQTRWL